MTTLNLERSIRRSYLQLAFPNLEDPRVISPGSGYALWKEANGNSTSSF